MAGRVLFQNGQWRVNSNRIRTAKSCVVDYDIAKNRLMDKRSIGGGKVVYDWIAHMEEKNWVQFSQFCEAFRFAASHFFPQEFSQELYQKSVEYACPRLTRT